MQARERAKHSAGSEVEPAQAPAFQAAPVPKTLYRPAQLPAIHEAKPTEQQAFHLQSEARHQQVHESPQLFQCHSSRCMQHKTILDMTALTLTSDATAANGCSSQQCHMKGTEYILTMLYNAACGLQLLQEGQHNIACKYWFKAVVGHVISKSTAGCS